MLFGYFGKYRKQIEDLEIEETVRIINKYVPNEEVGLYFAPSDAFTLPYVSTTGSGIIQAAFGFNKPVISTKVGCFPEVIDDMRTGYIVPARDHKAFAGAVVLF